MLQKARVTVLLFPPRLRLKRVIYIVHELEPEIVQKMFQHNKIFQVNHNYNEMSMRFFINIE